MFEDSLIESGGRLRTNRGATTTISFLLQVALVGILVLIPLLFTEALPKTQLMTFLVAPPPPPPPPPPHPRRPQLLRSRLLNKCKLTSLTDNSGPRLRFQRKFR